MSLFTALQPTEGCYCKVKWMVYNQKISDSEVFVLNMRTPLVLLIVLVLSIYFWGCKNNANCSTANVSSSAVKLINKSFNEKSFKFTIPQIEGMQNKKIQALANKNIKIKLASPMEPADPKSSMTGNYKIAFQNNRLLAFQYDGLYMWPGAPHPAKINQGININLTTGEIFSLSDLFKTKINYKSELKRIIKAKEKTYRFKSAESDYYNDFTYEDFLDNFDDAQFVMHKDYLHLYYVGVYAVGTVAGYKIPYKDIMYLINSSGNLWTSLKNIN